MVDIVTDLDDIAVALVRLVGAFLHLVAAHVLWQAVAVVAAKFFVRALEMSNGLEKNIMLLILCFKKISSSVISNTTPHLG